MQIISFFGPDQSSPLTDGKSIPRSRGGERERGGGENRWAERREGEMERERERKVRRKMKREIGRDGDVNLSVKVKSGRKRERERGWWWMSSLHANMRC